MAIEFQGSRRSSGRKSPYQLAVEEVQAAIRSQHYRAVEAVNKGTAVPLGKEEVSDAVARERLRSGSPEERAVFLKDNGRQKTLDLMAPRAEEPIERPLPLGNNLPFGNNGSLGNDGGFA